MKFPKDMVRTLPNFMCLAAVTPVRYECDTMVLKDTYVKIGVVPSGEIKERRFGKHDPCCRRRCLVSVTIKAIIMPHHVISGRITYCTYTRNIQSCVFTSKTLPWFQPKQILLAGQTSRCLYFSLRWKCKYGLELLQLWVNISTTCYWYRYSIIK